jgi:hypothetical protein
MLQAIQSFYIRIRPNRREARAARYASTLVIIVAFIYCVFGCASTPRERYNVTATAYNATAIGLSIKQEVKPFPDDIWQRIQTDEKSFVAGLTTANQWLIDNGALADVPGAPFPPLDAAVPILNILRAHLRNFTGVVLVPTSPKPLDPPVPAITQPN